MRISRKKRPEKPLIPFYRVNENIRVPEVRVLDNENNNLGVFKIAEALDKAREMEVDLVEINPKAEPPVCKFIEFSHLFKEHLCSGSHLLQPLLLTHAEIFPSEQTV